jgi:radical SAM superfamily enzyme YgiQ (UPF0313 family)
MPQVVATWCEEAGHDVEFVCYTGGESLADALRPNTDLLFVSAFTQAAQTSYAISRLYRQRGTVTALGGPHARCYPEDASQYFDYVLGFTDREVIGEVLRDCAPHRPHGTQLSARRQPLHLPSVRERWKFISSTLDKAPTVKIVPMIASLGCPYTCSFCIDSTVDYQALNVEQMKEDLRFRGNAGKPPASDGDRGTSAFGSTRHRRASRKRSTQIVDFLAESLCCLSGH